MGPIQSPDGHHLRQAVAQPRERRAWSLGPTYRSAEPASARPSGTAATGAGSSAVLAGRQLDRAELGARRAPAGGTQRAAK